MCVVVPGANANLFDENHIQFEIQAFILFSAYVLTIFRVSAYRIYSSQSPTTIPNLLYELNVSTTLNKWKFIFRKSIARITAFPPLTHTHMCLYPQACKSSKRTTICMLVLSMYSCFFCLFTQSFKMLYKTRKKNGKASLRDKIFEELINSRLQAMNKFLRWRNQQNRICYFSIHLSAAHFASAKIWSHFIFVFFCWNTCPLHLLIITIDQQVVVVQIAHTFSSKSIEIAIFLIDLNFEHVFSYWKVNIFAQIP